MAIRVHFPLEAGKAPEIGLAKAMRAGGSAGMVAPVGPEYSKYDRLNAAAPHFFESVDIDQADVIVYPYFAHTGGKTQAIANEARKRGVDCVFMSWGDEDIPVHVPHGTVYRHSLYSDHRVAHEFAMPAEVSDPEIETGSNVWPREWQDVPTIGFCGFVSNPFVRAVYRLSGRVRKVAGLSMRARVLRSLRRSKGIKTNFITRQLYWAGTEGRYHYHTARKFGPRAAFWSNIFNSDYTLCIRGGGNFSYRFYEVLAAGRIPLFVNTRCVLPFDNEIDWRRHCVWVEEHQMDRIGEIVREFHSRISREEFHALQMANRRLWETRLEPLSFYVRALTRGISLPPETATPPGTDLHAAI